MFYLIAISLIRSLLLKMAMYVLGYWVGINFYSMVPQFSTVYFAFSQFGIIIFTGCGLCQDTISTYKISIYDKNM